MAKAHVLDIANMPDPKVRFAHVIKHLYAYKERWDLAIPGLPPNLRAHALAKGCDARNLEREAPSWHGSCDSCRRHVLEDHDCYYQPAYQNAIVTASSSSRHGRLHSGHAAFVGDNGVFVVARQTRTAGSHVSTAYRVEPRGMQAARATANDFFLAAERKLRDKTDYAEDE